MVPRYLFGFLMRVLAMEMAMLSGCIWPLDWMMFNCPFHSLQTLK
jgi:hypothetical protein